MDFLRRFFRKDEPEIQCPRCLGKGNVDWEDIKRLNKELKWAPDRCAYCNGAGTVHPDLLKKVAVDESYLTTDLSPEEHLNLLRQDPAALEQARQYDERIDNFIKQILHLHTVGNMDPLQIAEFYLIPEPEYKSKLYLKEKEELADYIRRAIEKYQ